MFESESASLFTFNIVQINCLAPKDIYQSIVQF